MASLVSFLKKESLIVATVVILVALALVWGGWWYGE